MVRRIFLFALASIGALATADNGWTQTAQPEPVFMRQHRFQVPFAVGSEAGAVRSVRLFASTNRGATWEKYAEQPPTIRAFDVQVQADGEYFFASQTVYANALPIQSSPAGPQLIVVVDTQRPSVSMRAWVDHQGMVQTDYQVRDANLNHASVSMEIQSGQGQPWQPVNLNTARVRRTAAGLNGTMRWPASGETRDAVIRLTVQDRAGNQNATEQRIVIPSTTAPQNATQPRLPNPNATSTPTDPFRNAPANSGPNLNPQPNADNPLNAPLNGQAQNQSIPPIGGQPAQAVSWPINDRVANANTRNADSNGANLPNDPRKRNPFVSHSNNTQPATTVPKQSVPNQSATAGQGEVPLIRLSELADSPPVQGVLGDTVKKQYVSEPQTADQLNRNRDTDIDPHVPAGDYARLTNEKQFTMEYDVQSVGPEGVAKVELWMTRNQGKTWTLWGTDPDGQSPMNVQLNDEGLFGFRVVVTSASGLAGAAPSPGESADLWVGVDTTQPNLRLQSALYGRGEYAGHLDIRWQASDANLGERPVTLMYSESVDGPWTTIAAGIPNSGQYYWPIDARIPKLVYLRMKVTDRAENIATDSLPDAVDIDGLIPKARILGIRTARRN